MMSTSSRGERFFLGKMMMDDVPIVTPPHAYDARDA